MRRVLAGLAGAAVLGYAGVRAVQSARELVSPSEKLPHDAAAYGRRRRTLMLMGIARSLAEMGALAYGLSDSFEARAGAKPSRAKRVALVALAIVGTSILDTPVDFVEGFALERQYGLSKQGRVDWLAERIKGLGLSLAIGVPLVELLATAIDKAPRTWPIVATAGALPLLVLANVIAPVYIAPLFNTFEPLDGELADEVRHLAGLYGAGDAAILRVDMSRQTEKANAYVVGLLGTKRIVIGDTLLGNFEPRETLFVVAHELGHYVSKDVWRMVAAGGAAAGLIFFGAGALAKRDGYAQSSVAGLARLFFWISATSIAIGPVLAAFSRSRERAADEFAIAVTGDAAGGAAAFVRLRDQNMAEDEQPLWMEKLFSTHPSLRKRIERLEEARFAGG